jgi:5-methylcytosine-specific restriction endonuclease McrA
VTLCLTAFVQLAFVQGEGERAALLAGAAEGLRQRVGLRAWPLQRQEETQMVAHIRQALGADQFDQNFAAGVRLRNDPFTPPRASAPLELDQDVPGILAVVKHGLMPLQRLNDPFKRMAQNFHHLDEQAFDVMSESPFTIKHMTENLLLSAADDLQTCHLAEPGPRDPDPLLVPLERLEERICELAAHLAAGTCRFLQLVAEFDARHGWACWDLPSCAAWLAWKCQVAPGTAREQVRVARSLASLPHITAEFSAGRMSYAKVRALTRVATAATEADLAEIAGPMTAAQCERFAAAHRKASDAEELASWAARRVSVHVGEDGSVAISAKLPAADGAVVLQALRAAAGDCEHPHRPHGGVAEDATPAQDTRPAEDAGQGTATCRASLADALVEVAGAYLAGKITTAGNPDIYQVIVHAGPEALTTGPDASDPATAHPGVPAETSQPAPAATAAPSHPPAQPALAPAGVTAQTPAHSAHPSHLARCHLDDGPAISPAAAQALACHATVSWMLHDHDGTLLDVGRRHRRATPALRRAVRERDKSRCQFPGCNSRRTDIHHIIPWAKGGKTRLRDLILLCEAHHVIVHALGYLITHAHGGFAFNRPDGQPVPSGPALPGSDGDLASCHDADITTDTIVPAGLGDKLDLDLAIWACFANARVAAEQASQHQEQDLAA